MIKKRLDIMVDIETLGVRENNTVFQIAAMAFCITTGDIFSEFNLIADISKEKLVADGNTIKWWLKTDKELFFELLSKGTLSESELFSSFHDWMMELKKESQLHLWGKGILFDNNIIRTKLEKNNLKYPIEYNKDRDVRTILELASFKRGVSEKEIEKEFSLDNVRFHDAYDDVRNQIHLVHNCYKILMS